MTKKSDLSVWLIRSARSESRSPRVSTPEVPGGGFNISGTTNPASPPPTMRKVTKEPMSTLALGRLRGRGVPEAEVSFGETNLLPQLPQKVSVVATRLPQLEQNPSPICDP